MVFRVEVFRAFSLTSDFGVHGHVIPIIMEQNMEPLMGNDIKKGVIGVCRH